MARLGKLALSAMASLFLWTGGALAANAVSHVLTNASSQPAAGQTLPVRMPRTSNRAFPAGGDPAARALISGRAAARGTVSGRAATIASQDVSGMAYGYGPERWPYTTARVASSSGNATTNPIDSPVSASPYRQTGKLIMLFGSTWYECTASLILPNVLVTAAHCVHDFGLGDAGFANTVKWVPANTGDPFLDPSPGTYGVWTATNVVIPASYWSGTDTCAKSAPGIACNNDIAVVALQLNGGQKAGVTLGGTYVWGWNGYSYVRSPAFNNLIVADITQLGYPGAFDSGYQMQRNNSFGKYVVQTGRKTTTRKPLLNTQLGSALTGGSSGGPWLVNFGTRPNLDAGADLANASVSNVIVGVTSYGYTDAGLNVQGASFFGQNYEFPLPAYGIYGGGNIGALVQYICTVVPDACVY
jgi:hypothetical protein